MFNVMKMKYQERGSVFVIALWVLFFLSVVALRLAHSVRSESKLVRRYLDRMKSFYVARGALFHVADKCGEDKQEEGQDSYSDDWIRVFQTDREPHLLNFLDDAGVVVGTYRVWIRDEASRIDINRVSKQTLEFLFHYFNEPDAGLAAQKAIVYRETQTPEKKLRSVRELLHIPEIEERFFWGEDINGNGLLETAEDRQRDSFPSGDGDSELDFGIKDFLTIYTDGRININTAQEPVLLSMPGMDQGLVDSLIKARERDPFKSVDDLKNLPGMTEAVFADVSPWSVVRSDVFRVTVIAEASQTGIERQIVAVIDRSPESPVIRYWRQD